MAGALGGGAVSILSPRRAASLLPALTIARTLEVSADGAGKILKTELRAAREREAGSRHSASVAEAR
jgi:hypothetical protein